MFDNFSNFLLVPNSLFRLISSLHAFFYKIVTSYFTSFTSIIFLFYLFLIMLFLY